MQVFLALNQQVPQQSEPPFGIKPLVQNTKLLGMIGNRTPLCQPIGIVQLMPKPQLDRETYNRLTAEAKAPYKGLRKFVYGACAASGFIGAVVFLSQLLAGRDVAAAFPNFALQLGVIALMVWLFRLESKEK